jgi:CRISPR-associated protein Cas1
MILVIDKRETTIRYRAGSLFIESAGRDTRRAPLKQLEQVIVYGNPLAETNVWRSLAAEGIPTVLLSARGKPEVAMIGSGLATQLPLRRLQHRCADDQPAALKLAKRFIALKLESYDLPIATLATMEGSDQPVRSDFIAQRTQAMANLETEQDINAAMGVEGAVAHAWFALLAGHLPAKWKFSGRNRRPPQDPVNALLSLGYTLMHSELRLILMAGGFDPSLGFLHQSYPGRESLVLDFAEIFRSAIDDFVIKMMLGDLFDDSSFYYRSDEGCRLSKVARPRFFKAWADLRDNWPRPANRDADPLDWPVAPLRELVGGQLATMRSAMEELVVPHG